MSDPDMKGPTPGTARPATAASFGDLLSDLVREVTGLVRSEGRLVRAEIAEAGRTIASGAEMIAAGAVLLLVALIVLAQAVVIVLAQYVGPGWAATIVGAVLGLLGAILIMRGQSNIKAAKLVPERTLEQTSRDVRLAKEQV
jgi:protein-S-isoprenylcysteine O-methyltransferase Ste14